MMNMSEFIVRFWRNVYRKGSEVASPALVLFSIPIVAVFQFPAHLINRLGYLSTGILANEIIAVLGVPLILIALLKFNARRLLPFGAISFAGIVILLAMMLGADVVIDYMTHASEMLWPLPTEVQQQLDKVMAAPDAQTFILKVFVLCIVPPVCEEIYFRGFMQTSLAARWGNVWAIVVTAIVFAMMHGNIHYFHFYVMLGLIFGWAYAVTGTLWASIACHVFNNCWTFANHVRGFELPLEGAPPHHNILIALGGVVIFFVSAYIIKGSWKR